MSLENYKKFIGELGKSLKIKDLSPDADNYCCLKFDNKITTHIQYNKEGDMIMLFAQLGAIDEDKTATLYPRLLQANLYWQGTGGATIGVDEETREVLLSYQTPMQLLDYNRFQQLIEGFINTAELWINTLQAVQTGKFAKAQSK